MRLLPFATVDAATVAGWPTSAAEVAMWCGRREFPVSPGTVDGWQRDDDVQAHLPVEASLAEGWNAAQPVAYVWLRHDAAGAGG
ncbi:hypothetical protein ACIO1C_15090 [Streptomyces sp. NPDC087420]|uniref:hypothetical protein n=1 Tax=Streptomyces sp. NPDC087420 TaxID=3365785 RepID=UPI003837EFAA